MRKARAPRSAAGKAARPSLSPEAAALTTQLQKTPFSELAIKNATAKAITSRFEQLRKSDAAWSEALAAHIVEDAELRAKILLLAEVVRPPLEIRALVLPPLTYALLIGGVTLIVTGQSLLGYLEGGVLLATATALLVTALLVRWPQRLQDHLAALRAAIDALSPAYAEHR